MKKIIYVLALSLLSLNYYGQCITFSVDTILPSCGSCCDGSVTINITGGGCPPYNYVWSTGASGPITGLCFDSTVTLTISDAGGCCSDTSMMFRASSTTGIGNIHKKEVAVAVFPNPANTYLSILIEDNNTLFPLYADITDATGKEVLKTIITQKKHNINIIHLPNGIYHLTLRNATTTTIKKIAIVR